MKKLRYTDTIERQLLGLHDEPMVWPGEERWFEDSLADILLKTAFFEEVEDAGESPD